MYESTRGFPCTHVDSAVVGTAEQRGQECVHSNPSAGQKML